LQGVKREKIRRIGKQHRKQEFFPQPATSNLHFHRRPPRKYTQVIWREARSTSGLIVLYQDWHLRPAMRV
jgi:hypothetical protein